MDYIIEEKRKEKGSRGYIDVERSSDGMYGLEELLDDSYSFYSDYYEKEKFHQHSAAF